MAGVSACAVGAETAGAEVGAGDRAAEFEPLRRQAAGPPASSENSNEATVKERRVKTPKVYPPDRPEAR